MKNSIEVKNLTKKYDTFTLDHVSFSLPQGMIMGLVGENGAGKTTLIKLLLDLISKEEGEISLLGQRTRPLTKEIKEQIGVILDGSFFSEWLTPKAIGVIMKEIYSNWDDVLYQEYLRKFDLPENKMQKQFSKGMKMKLQLATALSHHPKLLLLDEPTSGLDPVVRNEILDIFQEFIADGKNSILLSTHITSDLEHIADYITFIHQGKILLSSSREELLEQYGIVQCTEKEFLALSKEEVFRFRKNRYQYEVLVTSKKEFQKKHRDLVVEKATIEDIMVLVVKGEQK